MISLLPLLALACTTDPPEPGVDLPLDAAIVDQLSWKRMQAHTNVLADDRLGGRIPGSYGHHIARQYIEAEMGEIGLLPIGLDDSFLFPYDNTPRSDRFQALADGTIVPQTQDTGWDLVGLIPGSNPALAHETIVLMAHYDHLGVTETGEIFNGSFDNAAAVAMLLEISRVLISENVQFDRSVAILFTDDEEAGLDGARAWIGADTVAQEDIVFGVSLDPLGRAMLPDFSPIVLIGLDRNPSLEARFRETEAFSPVPVVFIHRDVVPIFSSDQDPFLDRSVPAIWFTNPGFSFYHTVNDTPETIDYRMLLADAQYTAQFVTWFGRDDERFEYEGAQEPGVSVAHEAKRLFQGVLDSTETTTEEREYVGYFMDELDRVIDEGSMDALDHAESFFTAGLYFLLFELGESHPGPIPPVTPDED